MKRMDNFPIRKKLRRIFLIIAIIFAILYLPFTQYTLTEILNVKGNLQPVKAIVVLGGGVKSDGSPGISTEERINYAASLFKKGFANYIILSGGDKIDSQLEVEQMYKIALAKGVSPEALIKEAQSLNTYENAIYTKKLLSQQNIESNIILVTSPYHMRRALLCFEKQGIEVLAAPVRDSEIYTYGFYQNWRNLRLIAGEFLALAYYWYTGRI